MDAGRRFIDALKMFYHVANIGDARSLAIHPASTTHSQLTPEEQLQTGVTDGYVRLSLGIEHEDDILADLTQALGGRLIRDAQRSVSGHCRLADRSRADRREPRLGASGAVALGPGARAARACASASAAASARSRLRQRAPTRSSSAGRVSPAPMRPKSCAGCGAGSRPIGTRRRRSPLCRRLPTLIERGGGRMLRCSTFYEDFVKTVLTVNTSWSGTCRMIAALVAEPGGGALSRTSERCSITARSGCA